MKQIRAENTKLLFKRNAIKLVQIFILYVAIIVAFSVVVLLIKTLNKPFYWSNKYFLSYWILGDISVILCCTTYDYINWKKGLVAFKVGAWFSLILFFIISLIFSGLY